MTQNSSLEKNKSGLEEEYEARRSHTLKLGKQAIDALLLRVKRLHYTMFLRKQKNLMSKVKEFTLIPLEIMKNYTSIIKRIVRAIRKRKKNSKSIFTIVKKKNVHSMSSSN
jgi:hypothetical protein